MLLTSFNVYLSLFCFHFRNSKARSLALLLAFSTLILRQTYFDVDKINIARTFAFLLLVLGSNLALKEAETKDFKEVDKIISFLTNFFNEEFFSFWLEKEGGWVSGSLLK